MPDYRALLSLCDDVAREVQAAEHLQTARDTEAGIITAQGAMQKAEQAALRLYRGIVVAQEKAKKKA